MKVLLFDTETTDLIANSLLADNHQPRVIEFYGQVVDEATGEVLHRCEFLCNPGIPVPALITKITGITTDDVKNEPPFRSFEKELRLLFSQADAAVAHNLKYDWQVLNMEFKRNGLAPLDWPPILICTVEETEWFKGHRLKLQDLHSHLFGENFADAHRARNDVEALTRCWLRMKEQELV